MGVVLVSKSRSISWIMYSWENSGSSVSSSLGFLSSWELAGGVEGATAASSLLGSEGSSGSTRRRLGGLEPEFCLHTGLAGRHKYVKMMVSWAPFLEGFGQLLCVLLGSIEVLLLRLSNKKLLCYSARWRIDPAC